MIKVELIRERLIEAIKSSEFSQAEIARRVGVSSQAIDQYLHHNKLPAFDTFANLCKALDESPLYLLGIED